MGVQAEGGRNEWRSSSGRWCSKRGVRECRITQAGQGVGMLSPRVRGSRSGRGTRGLGLHASAGGRTAARLLWRVGMWFVQGTNGRGLLRLLPMYSTEGNRGRGASLQYGSAADDTRQVFISSEPLKPQHGSYFRLCASMHCLQSGLMPLGVRTSIGHSRGLLHGQLLTAQRHTPAGVSSFRRRQAPCISSSRRRSTMLPRHPRPKPSMIAGLLIASYGYCWWVRDRSRFYSKLRLYWLFAWNSW